MYSQNREEEIISAYYPIWFKGTVLDIGANDGKTLSNSLALIEKAWMGVLIEPDPNAYKKLWELHSPHVNHSVYMYNTAIGNKNGVETLYSTGDHLHKGDTGLLSTLIKEELSRFPGEFDKSEAHEVQVETFANFYERCPFKNYDFISIDAEGLDLAILQQIDLSLTRTSLLCVEFNGKDEWAYERHVRKFGFKLIHKNGENLIYGL